jgi:hypothetical protein
MDVFVCSRNGIAQVILDVPPFVGKVYLSDGFHRKFARRPATLMSAHAICHNEESPAGMQITFESRREDAIVILILRSDHTYVREGAEDRGYTRHTVLSSETVGETGDATDSALSRASEIKDD